jgi:hypothetical protein
MKPNDITAPTIDAGDTVLHRPSGEKWLVACIDVTRTRLSWFGWPEGCAEMSDCDLIKKATPQERVAALRTWADKSTGDFRSVWARWALERDAEAAPSPHRSEIQR